MSETNESIYADPKRMLELADDLFKFTNSLHKDSIEIENALHNLGRTWKDEDFEKFSQLCKRLRGALEELSNDVHKREPELRADAEALIQYLKFQLT